MKHSLEELKRMREGITPGPWKNYYGSRVGVSTGDDAFERICEVDGKVKDCGLIASSPDLLDQLIALEEKVANVKLLAYEVRALDPKNQSRVDGYNLAMSDVIFLLTHADKNI